MTIAADLFGNGGDLGSERQIGRAQAGQQLPDAFAIGADQRPLGLALLGVPRSLRKGASSLNAVIIHGPNTRLRK